MDSAVVEKSNAVFEQVALQTFMNITSRGCTQALDALIKVAMDEDSAIGHTIAYTLGEIAGDMMVKEGCIHALIKIIAAAQDRGKTDSDVETVAWRSFQKLASYSD